MKVLEREKDRRGIHRGVAPARILASRGGSKKHRENILRPVTSSLPRFFVKTRLYIFFCSIRKRLLWSRDDT